MADPTSSSRAFLGEFKTAIEQEIAAAKANRAASAVALTAGTLIAPVGGAFHYRFDTSTRVRVPPDTEGELVLPDRSNQPIAVTVLDIGDLDVTLAVPEHIGPVVPAARLQTDLTMLLRRLIERIDEKGQVDQPAADRLLGFRSPSGKTIHFNPRNRNLNCGQQSAVASALGRDTTFVWGPPGTGKTFSIGELGAQLFLSGKTLLIASHTNTAVDGAILQIATALDGTFQEGDIIRVGEPVKPELISLTSNVEIVMRRIAEKRAVALRDKRQAAQGEHALRVKEAADTQRLFDISEWLSEAPSDLAAMETEAGHVSALEATEKSVADRLCVLIPQGQGMLQLRTEAAAILARRNDLERTRRELDAALAAEKRYHLEREDSEARLQRQIDLDGLSRALEPLRQRARQLPDLADARRLLEAADERRQEAGNRAAATEHELSDASETLSRIQGMGTIKRLWLKLPKPEEQATQVETLRLASIQAQEAVGAAAFHLEGAHRTEAEVREIANKLAPHEAVPDLATQQRMVEKWTAQVATAMAAYQGALEQAKAREIAVAKMEAAEDEFARTYGLTAEIGARQAEAYFEERARLNQTRVDVAAKRRILGEPLKKKLRELLDLLVRWDLADGGRGSIADMLASLAVAQDEGRVRIGRRDPEQIRLELYRLAADIERIEDELRSIEQQLRSIDQDLIANARILATTLTRAYLRDGIQSRVFDTVLVDEVSMAPIPAVWAVATLAERAIVVVGDFLQLPPIVQSDEALAKKWLGRDVFEVSGLRGTWCRDGKMPDYFMVLREQHRMHPAISTIVNELVYKGELRDGATVTKPNADGGLYEWLAPGPIWKNPVILIDTSRFGGWNIAKDKSRCNPLSAFLAAETVGRMLAPGRAKVREGHPRILVISPYRPHAKLLQVMLRVDGVQEEVLANTVHSFQGSEADAVVLDLVVDQPQWNTSITNPLANEEMLRLLNVALTRAQRRLVVIGNFDWLRKKGSKSFVGKTLLPWFEKNHTPHQLLSANEFLATSKMLLAKDSSSAASAMCRLISDIREACERLVVFSPFLSLIVIEQVTEALQAAIARDVRIFVVACPVAEYPRHRRDEGIQAEDRLRKLDVRLVHKIKMLEKMALIDDKIVWCNNSGLLDAAPPENEFSAFRRLDQKLTNEFLDIYQLPDLLEPYQSGSHLCPICNSEMLIADAGKNSSASLYWRCAQKGCFTRSLSDPPLQNGKLSLPCGTDIELGGWGGEPHWICKCGKHHRKKVLKKHLSLPKMRELVPKKAWAGLCGKVGFDPKVLVQQVLPLE